MKKLKVIWGNWIKKIKKWEIIKMINYKDEVKKLNDEIIEQQQKIKDLYDLNSIYRIHRDELDDARIKVASLEDIVKASDKALKEHAKHIKELEKLNDELIDKSFKLELESKAKQIQLEEYEQQIKDYRTEGRYLVKKVKPGRKANTIKTKISKPMSASVTRYMRGEHE